MQKMRQTVYWGDQVPSLTNALGSIAAPFSTMATFLINPTPVSEHFNQAYRGVGTRDEPLRTSAWESNHSIKDVLLIPLELIRSNRDSVRKTREAHLIDKAMTLEPHGRDELNS